MLVACRLAGLSALEAYYAGVRAGAQMRGGRGQGRARPGESYSEVILRLAGSGEPRAIKTQPRAKNRPRFV